MIIGDSYDIKNITALNPHLCKLIPGMKLKANKSSDILRELFLYHPIYLQYIRPLFAIYITIQNCSLIISTKHYAGDYTVIDEMARFSVLKNFLAREVTDS